MAQAVNVYAVKKTIRPSPSAQSVNPESRVIDGIYPEFLMFC
jgi:hypothetical protein